MNCDCSKCKEKQKTEFSNYKRLVAKFAYDDLLAIEKKYKHMAKPLILSICWDRCIRIDNDIFHESDLIEDEGK